MSQATKNTVERIASAGCPCGWLDVGAALAHSSWSRGALRPQSSELRIAVNVAEKSEVSRLPGRFWKDTMASFNAAAADMPGTKRKQLDVAYAADDDRVVLVEWDSKCVFELPGHQKENAQVRATKNLGGVCRVCVEQDEKRGIIVLEATKLTCRMKAVLDGSCILHDMFISKGKMCIEVPSTRTHIFINDAPAAALQGACKVLEKQLKCRLKSTSPGKTCANTVVPGTVGSRPGEQKLIEGRAEVQIIKRSPTKGGEITRSLGSEDLCSDQQRAVDAVMHGKNVFLTGGAGTGKSALLRYIIAKLEGRGGCIVTASTGARATSHQHRCAPHAEYLFALIISNAHHAL